MNAVSYGIKVVKGSLSIVKKQMEKGEVVYHWETSSFIRRNQDGSFDTLPLSSGGGGGGSDSYFSQSFVNQSSVVVTHNFNKYPSVTCIDASGEQFYATVVHNSVNQCTVSWESGLASGTIICN